MRKLTISATMNLMIVCHLITECISDVPVFLPGLTDDKVIAMETTRAADAALRAELKNRAVAIEKVAPTQNLTGTPKVQLTFEISVLGVLRVADSLQTISVATYIELMWQDMSLAWNSSEHNDIQQIELATDSIWIPDLQLLNSYEGVYIMDYTRTLTLNNSGWFTAKLPGTLSSVCAMDLTYYPYDQQKCSLLFHSFSAFLNISTRLDVLGSKRISKALNLGNEWELMNMEAAIYKLRPDDGGFPRLTLTLKRMTTFYTVCLVIPMVTTSYINPLVFLLPLESGEKISYLVTISVSTSVFVSYFADVMPKGLIRVPNLMMLLLGVNLESLLVLLATILVLWLHHRNNNNNNQVRPSTSSPTSTTSESDGLGNKNHKSEFVTDFQNAGASKARSPSRWSLLKNAASLDKIFFFVFVIGNTVFLLVLLHATQN